MDPKECLRQADQMISDLDFASARIRIAEYTRWRSRGGFEPIEVAGTLKRGDDFARECIRRLESVLAIQPVEFIVHVDASIPYSQRELTSLESARLYAIDQAKLIESREEPCGEIWCEDTIGNTWDLVEENGLYTWEPADVIEQQFPILDLPSRLIH
jgi:hypothetical protein